MRPINQQMTMPQQTPQNTYQGASVDQHQSANGSYVQNQPSFQNTRQPSYVHSQNNVQKFQAQSQGNTQFYQHNNYNQTISQSQAQSSYRSHTIIIFITINYVSNYKS